MTSISRRPRARRVVFAAASASLLALAGCPSSGPDAASPTSESCEPTEGMKAPKLKVASLSGGKELAIEPGKVTLVDFWASWCGPCGKSFPHYQDLYTKYKASGLDMIAVSVDEDRGDAKEFVKAKGVTFPVGLDDGQATAQCWKPDPMPTMFIVDKKGVVRHVHRKWQDGDEKIVEAQIKALL